jgi:diacylglycerol kinase family enzyme
MSTNSSPTISPTSLLRLEPNSSFLPLYTSPSAGKQYQNEDLPNFSLILSQHYLSPISLKQFEKFFLNKNANFGKLPTEQFSQLEKFFSLFSDLKKGLYNCTYSPSNGSYSPSFSDFLKANQRNFGESKSIEKNQNVGKNSERGNKTGPNSNNQSDPLAKPLLNNNSEDNESSSAVSGSSFLNTSTQTQQQQLNNNNNNNNNPKTPTTFEFYNYLTQSFVEIDMIHQLPQGGSTNQQIGSKTEKNEKTEKNKTNTQSATNLTHSSPQLTKYTQTMCSKFRSIITHSQKWSSIIHNPLFTTIPLIPTQLLSTKTATELKNNKIYSPHTSNIFNNDLVLSEFSQLISPTTNNLNGDDINLRLTITPHALVFDIINTSTDPFLFYHIANNLVKTLPFLINSNNTDKLITIPTCPVQIPILGRKSGLCQPKDPSVSSIAALKASISAPLALQSINNTLNPTDLTPNHTHFQYYPLQHEATIYPASNPPQKNNNETLFRQLYGSFSLKFMIPLGNILAAPMYKIPSLSFPYHVNRTLSHINQSNAKISNFSKILETENLSISPPSYSLSSILRSSVTMNNVLALNQYTTDEIQPNIVHFNEALKNITILIKTTLLPHIDQSSSSPLLISPPPMITDISLSNLHISTPSDEALINLIKHERNHQKNLSPQVPLLENDDEMMSRDTPLSPGGTPLRPQQQNKLDVAVPRELSHNPTNHVTFSAFVGFYCSFNHPVVGVWAKQLDLLYLERSDENDANDENDQNDQNNQHIVTTPPSSHFSSNVPLDLQLPDLLWQTSGMTTSHGDCNKLIARPPKYGHYTRFQFFNLVKKLSHRSLYGDNCNHQPITPISFSLPSLFSIMTLIASQIHIDANFDSFCQLNGLVASKLVHNTHQTDQNEPNPPLFVPNTTTDAFNKLNMFSPVTSVWSLLSLPCPRSLLLCVNPKGGKGLAVPTLNRNASLLHASAQQIYVFITQYAGEVINLARNDCVTFGWEGDQNNEKIKQLWMDNLQNSVTNRITTSSTASTSSNIHENTSAGRVGALIGLTARPAYDTILLLSGDGLVNEVLNGIMKSQHWSWLFKHVTFCHVPCGSGNGLSSAVNSISLASSDMDNTFHFALNGSTRKVDIFTICQDPLRTNGGVKGSCQTQNANSPPTVVNADFYHSFDEQDIRLSQPNEDDIIDTQDDEEKTQNGQTSPKRNKSTLYKLKKLIPRSSPLPRGAYAGVLTLSWAFISDLDFESEKWRCCGGLRFEFAALIRMCFLRKYKAQVEFLLEQDPKKCHYSEKFLQKKGFQNDFNFVQNDSKISTKNNPNIDSENPSQDDEHIIDVNRDESQLNPSELSAIQAIKTARTRVPVVEPNRYRISPNLPSLPAPTTHNTRTNITNIETESRNNPSKSDPLIPSEKISPLDNNEDKDLHTSCGMQCRTCYQTLLKDLELPMYLRDSYRLELWTQNELIFESYETELTPSLGNIHGNNIINPLQYSGDKLPQLQQPEENTPAVLSSKLSNSAGFLSSQSTALKSYSIDDIVIQKEEWLPLYLSKKTTTTTTPQQSYSQDHLSILADDYCLIWTFNVSHGASDALGSPFSHLNNHFLDFYYIKNISRLELLDMLTTITNGTHANVPCVEHLQCKGIRLDPTIGCVEGSDVNSGSDHSSLMSLDGERIPLRPIEMRVWGGIINLICR